MIQFLALHSFECVAEFLPESSWNEFLTLSYDLNSFKQLQLIEQNGFEKRKAFLKDLVEKEKFRHEQLQVSFTCHAIEILKPDMVVNCFSIFSSSKFMLL